MTQEDPNKKPEGGKPPESGGNGNEKTFTQADLEKALQSERSKHAKELERFKDYEDTKKALEKFQADQLTEKEKAVKEATDALRSEFEPQVQSLQEVLEKFYEAEIADVPEEKRDIIPDLPLKDKLIWLKNAKSKGVFGDSKPEDSTRIPPGQSPKGDQNVDPSKLSGEEYDKYKQQKYGLPPARKSLW